jgi:hypothetical protein
MKRLSLPILAVVVAVSACADRDPLEPGAAPDDPSFNIQDASGQLRLHGLDAEFAAIATEVAGFGGMFYDEAGDLNVYIARGQLQAAEEHQVKAQLGRSLQSRGHAMPPASQVVLVEAEHDFLHLATLNQRMLPVLTVPGVVFTDIDESQNRLRIGIEKDVSPAHIQHALQMLNVPLDMVALEVTEPIEMESGHTLRHRQRPVAGGLQINFTRVVGENVLSFVCTLGFNILRDGRGRSMPYFITNSHCSDTRGEVKPTPYWQHSRFADETFIGWEFEDPPFFTGEGCFEGWQCRYSDALIAQYSRGDGASSKFGAIYRTLFPGTTEAGSIEVDEEQKFFTITGEQPSAILGQTLHKVGRTSGWTMGPVVATCVNTGIAGLPNTAMLCQDRVNTRSAGGDSGSPYFTWDGDGNNVTLVGIHWGSGAGITVLSPMANIRHELGPFHTH